MILFRISELTSILPRGNLCNYQFCYFIYIVFYSDVTKISRKHESDM